MAGPLPLGDPAPTDGRMPDDLIVDPRTPLSAYVHVPFCAVRCGYCDFNTYTATELRGARQDEYAGTLAQEVSLARSVLAEADGLRPLHTVFFGGGTPTILPGDDLVAMLDDLREGFGIRKQAEITVEANPDTVTPALAEKLATAGVTRLSLGMQSAVPAVLAALDRTHNPENVRTAVEAARGAGLAVSVDLIYGAPGESLDDWSASVDAALELEPDHISAYALIIEEGTKLARQIRRGDVPTPDDDVQADMYELVDERLSTAGFHWYEVSNWARSADQQSQHNLAYWRGTDWWGFGPGAHSHVAGLRWWNVKHPAAYAQRLAAGESPAAGREQPDPDAQVLERVLLHSRLAEGLSIDEIPQSNADSLAGLIADGLIEGTSAVRERRLVLTRRGRLLADAVVRALTD